MWKYFAFFFSLVCNHWVIFRSRKMRVRSLFLLLFNPVMIAVNEWLDYTQKHYKSSVKRLKAISMYLCLFDGYTLLLKSCLFFAILLLMHIEWCCNNLTLPYFSWARFYNWIRLRCSVRRALALSLSLYSCLGSHLFVCNMLCIRYASPMNKR